MNKLEELSEREYRYLTALKTSSPAGVRLKDLAATLGVSTPSAHEEVKHLSMKGMVINRRGMISLSTKGRRSLERLRAVHLALETILTSYGYGKGACGATHSFEYAIPPRVASAICDATGRPRECPQGHSEC